MNDTLVTIIAIFIAAILMFVFPLMTIADRNDDVAQQAVQQKTVEFVDKERNVGAITQSDLSEYKEEIAALGHSFNVDIEQQVLQLVKMFITQYIQIQLKNKYMVLVVNIH